MMRTETAERHIYPFKRKKLVDNVWGDRGVLNKTDAGQVIIMSRLL